MGVWRVFRTRSFSVSRIVRDQLASCPFHDLIQVADDVIGQRRRLVRGEDLPHTRLARSTPLAVPVRSPTVGIQIAPLRICFTVWSSPRKTPSRGITSRITSRANVASSTTTPPNRCFMRLMISSSITAISKPPAITLSVLPTPERISTPASAVSSR